MVTIIRLNMSKEWVTWADWRVMMIVAHPDHIRHVTTDAAIEDYGVPHAVAIRMRHR